MTEITSKSKPSSPAHLGLVTRIFILTGFYFVGGIVGRNASFLSETTVLIWPPTGIAIAAILLFGYKFWPGVCIGASLFAIALSNVPTVFFTMSTAIGNTVGALTCAYLLKHFVGFRNSMDRVRDVAGLVGLACGLGTTVNATFNAVGLSFAGVIGWDDLFSHVIFWWIPNAMAVLIVAPLILSWGSPTSIKLSTRGKVEALICTLGLIISTKISFFSWYVYGLASYPWAYLPYPFLVWASLRFGQRGATTGTFIITILSISSLLDGRGPFISNTEQESLILVGTYLSILAISNMLLASLVSERLSVEEALRQSEQRFRAVVEDQTELIWRFTDEGVITFVNDAYCRFHGKTRQELIGSSFLPNLSAEDRMIPLSFFGSLTENQPVVTYDDRVTSAQGDYVWLQCSTRKLFDSEGNPVEFQSVGQDITTRKQKEDEIRHGEERLRAILESIIDGVIVVDASGCITSMNPAAERIFALPAHKAIGKLFRELVGDDDRESYETYFTQRFLKGMGGTIEVAARRPDYSEVPIDLAISELKLGGMPMLIIVVRDISERKSMEEQFRQSQKMEAVGRLAGGIAHDFNNFMQAIIGYANMLHKKMGPGDENRETVQLIEKSAEGAATLTSQLLTFSRRQVVKPQVFCLNAVVMDTNKMLKRLIGEDIEVVYDPDPALGNVKMDAGQTQQVIMNLALNARDAMLKGGLLTLSTRNMKIETPLDGFSTDFSPGNFIMLSVADTGEGMTDQVKLHLFEPFFTTKEVGKGTGLGLSIVYGIVRQAGGEITVESELNRGTVFRIYLPQVNENAEQEIEQHSEPVELAGTETILLVEDGDIVRAMLKEVLIEQGYNVMEASNGQEALAIAREHDGSIELLVTDLIMPQLNGQELAENLKNERPEIKVIYISGYTDDEAVQRGNLNKGDFYLQKPFRPEVLLTRTREILDKGKSAL